MWTMYFIDRRDDVREIAAIRSQIIKCTSEKEENELLEKLETIIEAIQCKDSNADSRKNAKTQHAWNKYYAETYKLKIDLRKKKERYIRTFFPNVTLEDIEEVIGIEGSMTMLPDVRANKIGSSSLVGELKKDGTQSQSWLARNAVSEKEYMHYVLFIRNEIEQDSIYRPYSENSRRIALAYMDPNAPNGEIGLVADMESGLLLFCEAQIAKGKMSLKQFIQEKYLTDISNGKYPFRGPIHYMNCKTYWSNCIIM